jgi:hypothetical protein
VAKVWYAIGTLQNFEEEDDFVEGNVGGMDEGAVEDVLMDCRVLEGRNFGRNGSGDEGRLGGLSEVSLVADDYDSK